MPQPSALPNLPGIPLIESPFFSREVEQKGLSNFERDVACALHDKGYAVIDFPDDDFDQRVDRILEALSPQFDIPEWRKSGHKLRSGLRLQDMWRENEDVKAVAANPQLIALLSKLYDRECFPFQTLNFPVGTQQTPHSDSVHFSTIPERFMVGVWVALEDIGPDQGPLVYYPGSHKWPTIYNDWIDHKFHGDAKTVQNDRYFQYKQFWRAMVEERKIEPTYFHAKKGQTLIWAANLIHGGSTHNDPMKTRWSQVTHYYFKGCVYYTPLLSDPAIGNLHMRKPHDISTGQPVTNQYLDTEYEKARS